MSLIESLLIFFAIVGIYAFLVFFLHKKGVLKKYNISFYGPMLMWRTQKGINFLKKIALKKRFWEAFGSSGIVLCFIIMIVITAMFIWQTWFVLGLTPEQTKILPGVEIVLLITGINPIFPLEYILEI